MINLSNISDSEIIAEYNTRFTKKVGEKITGATDIALHLKTHFEYNDREQFVVVFLNGANEIISTEILFTGSLTASAVYIRELIKSILKHEAGSIILGHNHPSGNINPSKEDVKITHKIIRACNTIDVAVHDHIIIGNGYTSFADKGLMTLKDKEIY